MSIVEDYWDGVLQRLQAEVDILARLVKHSGEMGRENEVALQRVLERLLPRKYGIGTGLLIDARGGYSKQMDLIVHDQQEHPTLFSQTTSLLYPHEVVYACIQRVAPALMVLSRLVDEAVLRGFARAGRASSVGRDATG